MLPQINSVLHLAADAYNRHNHVNSADNMFSPLHVWDLLEPLPPDPSEKASRKRTAPEPSTPDAFRTFAFQGELKVQTQIILGVHWDAADFNSMIRTMHY